MKNMNPMDFCPNPPDIFLFPFYCSQIFMTVYVTFNEAKKKILSRMTVILLLVMRNSPMKLNYTIFQMRKVDDEKDVFRVTLTYENRI